MTYFQMCYTQSKGAGAYIEDLKYMAKAGDTSCTSANCITGYEISGQAVSGNICYWLCKKIGEPKINDIKFKYKEIKTLQDTKPLCDDIYNLNLGSQWDLDTLLYTLLCAKPVTLPLTCTTNGGKCQIDACESGKEVGGTCADNKNCCEIPPPPPNQCTESGKVCVPTASCSQDKRLNTPGCGQGNTCCEPSNPCQDLGGTCKSSCSNELELPLEADYFCRQDNNKCCKPYSEIDFIRPYKYSSILNPQIIIRTAQEATTCTATLEKVNDNGDRIRFITPHPILNKQADNNLQHKREDTSALEKGNYKLSVTCNKITTRKKCCTASGTTGTNCQTAGGDCVVTTALCPTGKTNVLSTAADSCHATSRINAEYFFTINTSYQGEYCEGNIAKCQPNHIFDGFREVGLPQQHYEPANRDIQGYNLVCVDAGNQQTNLDGYCRATCANTICPYEPRLPNNPESVHLAYTIGCFKPYIEPRCINYKGFTGNEEVNSMESCADPPSPYLHDAPGFTLCKKGYNPATGSTVYFNPHGMDWNSETGAENLCMWTFFRREAWAMCDQEGGSCDCYSGNDVNRVGCKCYQHTECKNNICELVDGKGADQCSAVGSACEPPSCGTAAECIVSCDKNLYCETEQDCAISSKKFWYGDTTKSYSFTHDKEEKLNCTVTVETACFGGNNIETNEKLRVAINGEFVGITEDDYCNTQGTCSEDGPQTTTFTAQAQIKKQNTIKIEHVENSVSLTSLYMQCHGEKQYTWDRSESGYCRSPSQCLVNPYSDNEDRSEVTYIDLDIPTYNDIKCIDSGQFIGDHYCDNGIWTTRTKAIALQLLQSAENYNPDDYVLFCDNYLNTLNYYDYDIVTTYGTNKARDYLSNNCEVLNTPVSCINKVCVLKYKTPDDDNYKVAVGTSLNHDMTQTQSYSIMELFGQSLNYCNRIGEDYGQFQSCDPSQDMWFNKNLNSIIYSRDSINLGKLSFSQKFLQFLKNPFTKIFNTILKVIKPKFPRGAEFDYDFIKDTEDFDRIYIANKDSKNVRGIIEEIGKDKFMSVTYDGFEANICKSVEPYWRKTPAFGVLSCNETSGTYYIETLYKQRMDAWQELTSKLRVK